MSDDPQSGQSDKAERILPQHIAIVMDGNNRWAKLRKLPAAAGHKSGVESIRTVLEACRPYPEIKYVTVFAFSTENWSRPEKEVSALMKLFLLYLKQEVKKLNEENTRLKVVGRRDRFTPAILQAIENAESATASNTARTLIICADYGGQWDIVDAARKLAAQVQQGLVVIDDIDEKLFEENMSLQGMPPVDLCIRTAGEKRISNFLLWHNAYAEFYFCDEFWPDFNGDSLERALHAYATRDRRYGGRNEDAAEAGAGAGGKS